MKDIVIRTYTDSDREKLFGLLSPFFVDMGCTEPWAHFFEGSPNGREIRMLAEWEAKKVLFGHYAVLKTPMTVFGRDYDGGKGESSIVDAAILRSLLKQGIKIKRPILFDLISHALREAWEAGMAVICSNPNNPALKPHLESGHDELRHSFHIFSFVLSRRYYEHLLVKKVKVRIVGRFVCFILAGLFSLVYSFKTKSLDKKEIKFVPLENFDAGINTIDMEFLKLHDCITMRRDYAYLNWRFSSDEYKKMFVSLRGQIIGYVIVRIFTNPNNFREACLVDYLFKPAYWHKFLETMIRIIELAKTYECDLFRVNYMYDYKERFNLSKAFKKLLFLYREDKRNIVVYIFQQLEKERARI